MRCDEFENILQRRADGQTSPQVDERFESHARNCQRCQALEQGFRRLDILFSARERIVGPAGMSERVLDALRQPATRRGWWIGPAAGMAVAASLLIAIAWKLVPRPAPTTDHSAQFASATHTSRVNQSAVADGMIFPESEMREEVMFVSALEPMSEVVRAVGRSFSGPVRPIAISASEALDGLFRDLPTPNNNMMPLPAMFGPQSDGTNDSGMNRSRQP